MNVASAVCLMPKFQYEIYLSWTVLVHMNLYTQAPFSTMYSNGNVIYAHHIAQKKDVVLEEVLISPALNPVLMSSLRRPWRSCKSCT